MPLQFATPSLSICVSPSVYLKSQPINLFPNVSFVLCMSGFAVFPLFLPVISFPHHFALSLFCFFHPLSLSFFFVSLHFSLCVWGGVFVCVCVLRVFPSLPLSLPLPLFVSFPSMFCLCLPFVVHYPSASVSTFSSLSPPPFHLVLALLGPLETIRIWF